MWRRGAPRACREGETARRGHFATLQKTRKKKCERRASHIITLASGLATIRHVAGRGRRRRRYGMVWVKGQNIVWVSDEHIAESPKLGGVIATPRSRDGPFGPPRPRICFEAFLYAGAVVTPMSGFGMATVCDEPAPTLSTSACHLWDPQMSCESRASRVCTTPHN